MDNAELLAFLLGDVGVYFQHLSGIVSAYRATGELPPSLLKHGGGRSALARTHKTHNVSGHNLFIKAQARADP